MNISDYIKPVCGALAAKTDSEIKGALDDFWGVWSLEDIKRRCQLVRVAGSPVETLYADGVPILEIHPLEFPEPEWVGDRYVQRGEHE